MAAAEHRRRLPNSGAGDEGVSEIHSRLRRDSHPSESLRGSSDAETASSSSSASTDASQGSTYDARRTIVRVLQIFLPFFLLHFLGKKNFEEGLKEAEPTSLDVDDYALLLDNPELAKEWNFILDESHPDKLEEGFPFKPTDDKLGSTVANKDSANAAEKKIPIPETIGYQEPDYDYLEEYPVPAGKSDDSEEDQRSGRASGEDIGLTELDDDEYDDDDDDEENDEDDYYQEDVEERNTGPVTHSPKGPAAASSSHPPSETPRSHDVVDGGVGQEESAQTSGRSDPQVKPARTLKTR